MKGLGKAFPDSVSLPKFRPKKGRSPRLVRGQPLRFLLFYFLLIFLFWSLSVKIFDLTILKGQRNRQLSEENRIKEEIIYAPRGIIYASGGEALVRNTPAYREEKTLKILTHKEVIELEAKGKASNLETYLIREYPYPKLFSHLLGYLGEISKKELEEKEGYKIGDRIGRTGLEQEYENVLRGIDGKRLIEVDAEGKMIKTLGQIDPIPGKNLSLSVNLKLQEAAEKGLKEKRGAVIASDPKTGEILALYSSPSFDLSLFSFKPKIEEVEKVFADPERPMFNRAISGVYPPGSTFKIITAAAALEEKVVDKETRIEDVGVIHIGPFSFPNWYYTSYGKKEGLVDVVKALQRSNDIFFYKVGEFLGVEKLAKWGRKFGIGQKLGIDLPGEVGGVMPDPEWRRKAFLGELEGVKPPPEKDWFLGDTYHLSIGQGDLLVTPLQVNFWTAVIANGGKLCQPRVVKEDIKYHCPDLGLKKETIALIKKGLRQACSPGGTGWPLFNFKVQSERLKIDGVNFLEAPEATTSGKPWVRIPTACKTGTAEFGPPADGQGKTHAWFTIFAPVEDPEIVVTVLVEEGGEGSNVAAPIAKKILEAWFGRL